MNKYLIQIIGLENLYRGLKLEQQLAGLPVEILSRLGVSVSNLEFERATYHDPIFASNLLRRKLTIGEVGARLAHRNTHLNLLNSNYDFSIILEDDVTLTEKIPLEKISEFMNSNTPMILLLGYDAKSIFIKSSKFKSIFNKLSSPPPGAFAYALNKNAAEILCGRDNKIFDLADWPLASYGKIEFWALKESIVDLESVKSNSTIDDLSPRVFGNHNLAIKLFLYIKSFLYLCINKPTEISIKQIYLMYVKRDLLAKFYMIK